MLTSMKRNGAILAGFALVTTGVLAVTSALTAPRIAMQQERELRRQLEDILPAERYDNALLASCREITSADWLGTEDTQRAWLATKDGAPVATLLETQAPDGYNGTIRLLVGIEADGSLAGVRTLSHQETPGLGDKIELERSDWMYSFDGQQLTEANNSQWKVKKDGGEFDQFTGATITPRAVVRAVKHSLIYFAEHQEVLYQQTAGACGEVYRVKQS